MITIPNNLVSFEKQPGKATYSISMQHDYNKELLYYRTPNNLTKGKSKLIIIQTDKISQQPKTVKTVMTLTWYRHF
jgi:hypothetical protein